MTFLIDAFNVIYKFSTLEEFMFRGSLEKAQQGLLEYLIKFKNSHTKKPNIHIFFDGKKKPGDETDKEKKSGMYIYYSLNLSADYLIKEFIKNCQSPGEIIAISSDKDIISFAKSHRCKIQKSEDFASLVRKSLLPALSSKPEKEENPRVSKKDIQFWLNIFTGKKKS